MRQRSNVISQFVEVYKRTLTRLTGFYIATLQSLINCTARHARRVDSSLHGNSDWIAQNRYSITACAERDAQPWMAWGVICADALTRAIAIRGRRNEICGPSVDQIERFESRTRGGGPKRTLAIALAVGMAAASIFQGRGRLGSGSRAYR